MDKKFYLMLGFIILALIFSISLVSASDDISCYNLLNSSYDLEHPCSLDENTNNRAIESEANDIESKPNKDNILSSSPSLENSHTAPTSFSNIQNAINDAKEGDTLILSGNYYDNNNQIRINKDKITIKGKSASNKAVLDAKDGQTRIFYITGDNVRLENLIFKNTNADTFGGAITATGSYLTILNCEFINNKAQVGAIVLSNMSDYAVIKNCIFKNNSGIYTKNNNGGWGGAIDSHGSHGQIANCTFTNNHAVNGGGAVYMKNGCNNTIKDCTFTNNTAPVGGAFALSPNYHDALVLNCRFHNNTAETNGGAIFVCNYTKITNCIFQDNHAGNNGGAVNGHYYINIQNSTFKSNHAGNYGGGAYFQTSKNHKLTGSAFIENTAIYGGAVATGTLAKDLKIECNNFNRNHADENGGALYLMGSTTVTSSNFTSNSANLGGAIYNNNELTLRDSIFYLNKADNGSALYNNNPSKVYNSQFKDNQAKSYALKTQNYTAKQGQTANIMAYLEYGDNCPGIYTKEKFSIDDLIPKLSSGVPNDHIALKINNKEYLTKTNESGFAVFKIPTNTLKPGNHKFLLLHDSTKISTNINESATLKIIKNKIKNKKNKKDKNKKPIQKTRKIANKKSHKTIIKNKKIKKTKKVLKSKKRIGKTNKPKTKHQNKVKIRTGLDGLRKYTKIFNSHKKHSPSQYDQLNDMSNGLLKFTSNPIARVFPCLPIASYTAGTFLKAGINSKSIWDFINYPFLTIPNYNRTMYNTFGNTLAPYAEGLIDFAVGIDENGQMSIGQLLINILSVTGIGFLGKIGGKISKLLRNKKYWTLFQDLINIQKYEKHISYTLEWVNDGVLLITKFNTGVVSTLYSIGKLIPKLKNFNPSKSKIIKKLLKNRTVKKLVNKLKKSKTFKTMTKKFNSLKNNMKKNINNLKNKGKKLLENSIKNIKNIKNNLITKVKKTVNKLKNTNIINNAKKTWQKLTNNRTLKKATEKMGKIKNNLISDVKKSFKNLKNSNIRKTIGNINKRIINSKVIKKTYEKLNKLKKALPKKLKYPRNNMNKGEKLVGISKKLGKKAINTMKSHAKSIQHIFDNDLRTAYNLVTSGYTIIKRKIDTEKTEKPKNKVLQERPKTKKTLLKRNFISKMKPRIRKSTKHKAQPFKKRTINILKKFKFW